MVEIIFVNRIASALAKEIGLKEKVSENERR